MNNNRQCAGIYDSKMTVIPQLPEDQVRAWADLQVGMVGELVKFKIRRVVGARKKVGLHRIFILQGEHLPGYIPAARQGY